MKEKEIQASFNWIDDEVASINCPYCRKEVTINIYKDSDNSCSCGKRFRLIQINKVVEIEEKNE